MPCGLAHGKGNIHTCLSVGAICFMWSSFKKSCIMKPSTISSKGGVGMNDFPQELLAMPRWVCWQRQPDPKHPDKPRKVPMAADGRGNAKVNAPKTWGTYEQAASTLAQRSYSGLGFMLGAGIIGVGIDHCVVEGEISPFAQEIMAQLPTYTELSPSGTGLHMLMRGEMPQGRRKGQLEIYGDGRYFTVTGQSVGENKELFDGTQAVEALLQRYMASTPPHKAPVSVLEMDNQKLIAKIESSKQGSQFKALMQGNHGGDASAADIALCNILAFWTGKDAARMDDIFRQSGLMRLKWDERHGRDTYGNLTIEKAIAECKDTYTGHKPRPEPAQEGSPFYPYEQAYNAVDGYACQRGRVLAERVLQGGEAVYTPLSNFAPLIKEEITRDDGVECRKEMRVEAIGEDGRPFPPAIVPAAKLTGMAWVLTDLGTRANIHAGQNKKDQLRNAMQSASLPGLMQSTVYSHTGWRKIGGKWLYLYHGGAIGAAGLSVELEGNLAAYSLPPVEAVNAKASSRAFLDMGALRITAPLLCTMYLAPLFHFMKEAGCAPAFIPFVAGATGTRKTTITTLALSHFGNFNPKQPPASFADTVNSIRRKAFVLKDMPLLVDDYHPNTDRRSRAAMCGAAQQLARAWGDHAERGRMQSDLTVKQTEPPRGMGIMSGEDVPDTGESGVARLYVIDVKAGDVYVDDALTLLQEQAARGVLAQAMRGYIEQLAIRANELPQALHGLFTAHRRDVMNRMPSTHGRIQEAVACLMVGMDFMAEYLGCVDMKEAIVQALIENATEQQSYIGSEKPVDLFMNSLRELLSTKRAHIQNIGDPFIDAEIVGCCQGDRVYLYASTAYKMVFQHCIAQGGGFPISKGQLWKRMNEQGLLETRGKELTLVKSIGGMNQRVLPLPKAAILGEEVQECIS